MPSLVTGGAGFIGSHLVDALIERGEEVVILDDLSTGRRENLTTALERGADLVEGDVTDPATVSELVKGRRPGAIFHLAAQIDVRVSVSGPRQDPLGEAGVVAIFCGALLGGRTPKIFGDGEQTRDYVYVADIVEALLAAGDSSVVGTFNIGTGVETSVLELGGMIADACNRPFDPEMAPPRPGEVQRIAIASSLAADELGWTARTAL